MKTERFFEPGDRYRFDFTVCNYKNGWAQVDTSQDASYFGTWANPFKLQIVCYCEGDITIQTAATPGEFATALRTIKSWNEDNGFKFQGIDGMCSDPLIGKFNSIGLADLMHCRLVTAGFASECRVTTSHARSGGGIERKKS